MRDTDYERTSRRDPRYNDGPNVGSARSDYGSRDFGGRLDERGVEDDDRGFVARASDEVKSWFGDEDAVRRRRVDEREDRRDDYGPRQSAYDRRPSYHRRPGRELAADLMTAEVVTARSDDPIMRAARIMRDEDVGAVPVVDRANRPVGMITDRDIACRAVAQGADVRRVRVEDVMTDQVFSCSVDASVDDCLRVMSRHQVRRLLVVDRDDRLVGIISQADLARRAPNERRAVADLVRDVSKPTSAPYR